MNIAQAIIDGARARPEYHRFYQIVITKDEFGWNYSLRTGPGENHPQGYRVDGGTGFHLLDNAHAHALEALRQRLNGDAYERNAAQRRGE